MKYISPLCVMWSILGIACLIPIPARAQGRDMGCSPTVANPCQGSSTGRSSSKRGGNPSTGYDYGAEERRRAAAEAETTAAADRQRQQDEADRIERIRLAEETRQKNARFISDRDKTAKTLKGGIGISASPNDGGLKGSGTVDTGLKELKSGERVPHQAPVGQQAAWKQLHCAAAFAGYAFAALKQPIPDYQESSFLMNQAGMALDGQALNVECPATPAFPDLHGGTVDLGRARESEKKILDRGAALVARMKQRNDPVATSAPAAPASVAETPDEKMRRAQRDLNSANSRKINGKTQQEIDQQERDRQEMARLILANNRIEMGVDIGEVAPRQRRNHESAPSTH